MSYDPTPAGLARDVHDVIHILSVARSNLDRYGYRDGPVEKTTAGTCYDTDNTKPKV